MTYCISCERTDRLALFYNKTGDCSGPYCSLECMKSGPGLNLVGHLYRQRSFSEKTFGPGARTKGVLDHLRKELQEIEKKPQDLSEWIDVVLLALDGAWRAGHSPEEIAKALAAKQKKNEQRKWPDWRTQSPDKAIEHDRSEDK